MTSLIWKVPDIESSFKIKEVTSSAPIWNLNTFSTIAVAPDVSPSIVRPIKSPVLPTVAIALKTLFVSHLPSDALNIFSLG